MFGARLSVLKPFLYVDVDVCISQSPCPSLLVSRSVMTWFPKKTVLTFLQLVVSLQCEGNTTHLALLCFSQSGVPCLAGLEQVTDCRQDRTGTSSLQPWCAQVCCGVECSCGGLVCSKAALLDLTGATARPGGVEGRLGLRGACAGQVMCLREGVLIQRLLFRSKWCLLLELLC